MTEKLIEIVVLVAFAAVLELVMALASDEVVLGGEAHAEQRGDIDMAVTGADQRRCPGASRRLRWASMVSSWASETRSALLRITISAAIS